MELICIGCRKTPEEIPEYKVMARLNGMTPSQYVLEKEGTLNTTNGHFTCTACYIKMGQPSRSRRRWIAP